MREKLIHLDYSKLGDSRLSSEFCQTVSNNLSMNDISYSTLASAVSEAATALLPKRDRPQPGWFKANESVIVPDSGS